MIVLAVDPNTRESAILAYDATSRPGPLRRGIAKPAVLPNEALLDFLRSTTWAKEVPLALESVQGYGQRASFEEFETARMVGRFQEAYERNGGAVHLVSRREVKMHLVGVMRAKDTDIRQALLHKFGDGTRAGACGTKANPGPLYGIGSHLWSALAIAVTYAERKTDTNHAKGAE